MRGLALGGYSTYTYTVTYKYSFGNSNCTHSHPLWPLLGLPGVREKRCVCVRVCVYKREKL